MNRLLFFMIGLLAVSGQSLADNISPNEIVVPKGGQTTLLISLDATEHTYTGFEFRMTLPDGVTAVANSQKRVGEFASTDHTLGMTYFSSQKYYQFASLSLSSTPIPTGNFIEVTLQADNSLETGTVLSAKFFNLEFTTISSQAIVFEETTFNITIGEQADNRVLLDENSTVMPTDAEGVDVRVKRTIKANSWSTLVLPFEMTGDQVKRVLGEDILMIDFAGYETTEDDEGNIVAIQVNFNSLDVNDGMEANHPYVVKVSSPVTEWTLDGVDITVEDEPTVAAIKRTKKQWSELVGTYVAQTQVPSTCLFLNNNLFWYSTGATKMKGYRAYFDFYDVLTDIEDAYAINIRFNIDGETTEIDNVLELKDITDAIYDLSGRRVNRQYARKGVYIVNGKKVLIK